MAAQSKPSKKAPKVLQATRGAAVVGKHPPKKPGQVRDEPRKRGPSPLLPKRK